MNIIHFKELTSTNKYAKENLEKFTNFDVILTDKQFAGYGQWGRKWIDIGSENIYMTIILKPESIESYTNIVRFTAICICNVFKFYGLSPKIKEPNDILINNKKISGILAESITKGDILKGIIIGIGININSKRTDLENIDQPATSLNLEINKKINKKDFLLCFFKEFEKNYVKFVKKEFNLEKFL